MRIYIDRRVVIWHRATLDIPEENYQELLEKIKEDDSIIWSTQVYDNIIDSEYLSETEEDYGDEDMEGDNLEIYDKGFNLLHSSK